MVSGHSDLHAVTPRPRHPYFDCLKPPGVQDVSSSRIPGQLLAGRKLSSCWNRRKGTGLGIKEAARGSSQTCFQATDRRPNSSRLPRLNRWQLHMVTPGLLKATQPAEARQEQKELGPEGGSLSVGFREQIPLHPKCRFQVLHPSTSEHLGTAGVRSAARRAGRLPSPTMLPHETS